VAEFEKKKKKKKIGTLRETSISEHSQMHLLGDAITSREQFSLAFYLV